MSPAAATVRPRMDPRIGRRRAEVTRARGRRRLRLLLGALAVAVLATAALAAAHSPLLSARHVTVLGASHTGRAAVVRAAGLVGGPPLLDVVPGAAAARLEALPWVRSARVSRLWPDRVVVGVVERVPVAAMTGARRYPVGTFVLVDASGRVLGARRSVPGTVPLLSARVVVGRPGTTLGPPARPGLLVAREAARVLPGRVHGVQVAGTGGVVLDLGGGVTAALGPAVSVDAKLAALASVLAGAPPAGPEVVDVAVPGEPTVAPG